MFTKTAKKQLKNFQTNTFFNNYFLVDFNIKEKNL